MTDSGPEDEQTFLIYGDLGVENSQCLGAIKSLVDSQDVDMIWHIGDFAYDMYDDNGKNADRFMNMVEPIASSGSFCKKLILLLKISSVHDDPWQPREQL